MISSLGFSQGIATKFASEEIKALPAVEETSKADLIKAKKPNTKLFRDTAYYYDFDTTTFATSGWTITNNNQNNAVWDNTGVFTPGQFSGGTPLIASTTASNGFMVLNGDLVNTPIPPTGVITMDTWFESDTIWISGPNATTPIDPNTVWVTYQQRQRYCCSQANQLVIEVSTDQTNWTAFDAIEATPVNTTLPTTSTDVNVTSAVCGNSYMFARFRSTGNSHYYWMIDDFAVIEGPEHDLVLSQEYMQFNFDNYALNPFYNQIPLAVFPALPFSAAITNNGAGLETGVDLEVDVVHTLDTAGNPGNGNVYSTVAAIDSLAEICDTNNTSAAAVLTPTPRFVPQVLGSFRVDYNAAYDSSAAEQIPADNSSSTFFNISDSVYARDDGGLSGGVGAHSYVSGGTPGGTAAGDRMAMLYVFEPNNLVTNQTTQTVPTSISYFVNTDTRNIGVEIVPKVWAFNEDSATIAQAITAEVASSFIPYVVQAADTNTILTLGLDAGSALTNGLDSGQYIVGWEVTSIAGGTTFEVYNDASTTALQPNVTCFVDFGHAPGWGWVDVNPAIRLNVDSLAFLITDVKDLDVDLETKFYVGPNPNNGIFEVRIQTNLATSYNLNVRNMLGQSIYNDLVGVNGQKIVNMDLSGVEKGVYFVTLENENGRLVEKIIIK